MNYILISTLSVIYYIMLFNVESLTLKLSGYINFNAELAAYNSVDEAVVVVEGEVV